MSLYYFPKVVMVKNRDFQSFNFPMVRDATSVTITALTHYDVWNNGFSELYLTGTPYVEPVDPYTGGGDGGDGGDDDDCEEGERVRRVRGGKGGRLEKGEQDLHRLPYCTYAWYNGVCKSFSNISIQV